MTNPGWQRAAHALRDAGAALFNNEENARMRWIAATLLYDEARDQMVDPQALDPPVVDGEIYD